MFEALFGYPLAAVIFFLCILLPIAFAVVLRRFDDRPQLHDNRVMVRAFIIFFAVNLAACFGLALATDGGSWSHMMHVNAELGGSTQFEEFFKSVNVSTLDSFSSV
ncbi:MAG: hypothetical protein K6C36_06250, partial [Clostridia bacterium]|nr:hypothetical protein [Clostridia bacterium]